MLRTSAGTRTEPTTLKPQQSGGQWGQEKAAQRLPDMGIELLKSGGFRAPPYPPGALCTNQEPSQNPSEMPLSVGHTLLAPPLGKLGGFFS